MAIEKVIDLQVKSNAEQAVGSLRTQLRAAQLEVATLSEKFGATSKEAVEAAKRAGELKDKIGDAKNLTDAFNPDAKFKSLTSSLAGVAGGFAAVQGGMALFGAESKDVEKTLLKVQAAMALSSGLQQLGEAKDSVKQLGAVVKSYSIVQKVVTAGQWLWNAAMAANPIGAIVAAVAALIAGGYLLVKMFMDSAESEKKAMAQTVAHTKELEKQTKEAQKSNDRLKEKNDHLLDMAKAAGKSSDELRKLALKHAEEGVELAKNNATIAANTFNRERNILATLKAVGASDEVIAAQQKLTTESYKEFQNQDKILVESYANRRKVVADNEVQILQEKTDATKKANEDRKAKGEKASEEEKARQKKDLEDLKNALKAQRDAIIANELEITTAIGDAQDKNAEAFMTRQEIEERAVNDKYFLLLERARQQGKDTLDLEIAQANEINDIRLRGDEEKRAQEEENKKRQKENADADIELAKKTAAARIEALDAVSNTLEMASDLAGKQTGLGKTLAIVAATISMFTSAQKAYESTVGIPFVGPTLAPINAGLAIAVGLKNIAAIKNVKVPNGGGGGGSVPSVSGGGGGGTTPNFNVVGNSGVNQLAGVLGNKEQTPIKAYVVPSDVTSGQSLDRNVISGASLG